MVTLQETGIAMKPPWVGEWRTNLGERPRPQLRPVPTVPEQIHLPAESLKKIYLALGELASRHQNLATDKAYTGGQADREELLFLRANLINATFLTYSWEGLMSRVAQTVRAWMKVHSQEIYDVTLPEETIAILDAHLKVIVERFLRPSQVKDEYLTPIPIIEIVHHYLMDGAKLSFQPTDTMEDATGEPWSARLLNFRDDVEQKRFANSASWQHFIHSPNVENYILTGQTT